MRETPARASAAAISAGKRSPCVRVPSPCSNASTRSSSVTATLPRASSCRAQNQHDRMNRILRSLRLVRVSSTSPPLAAPANVTPAMRQYFEAKRQYRHALLFFRMGDFYEMFYEDALVASRALDLTLTSRSKDASGDGRADVRRALSRRRWLHHAAGEEGLSRRDLRADRRPPEGQRRRQARGGPRRLARHADRRRRISTRASRRS